MMSMMRKLMEELERVVILREQYRSLKGQPNVDIQPAERLMTHSIELAKASAETGDPGQILLAINSLEGWRK